MYVLNTYIDLLLHRVYCHHVFHSLGRIVLFLLHEVLYVVENRHVEGLLGGIGRVLLHTFNKRLHI